MSEPGEAVRRLLIQRNALRQPTESESEFFAENPIVAGYAAEDDRVVLRPGLPPNHAPIVHALEGARIEMRRNGDSFSAPLTQHQTGLLRKWNARHYLSDPVAARQSVVSRIVSGDPSMSPYTPEQQEEAARFANRVQGDEDVFRSWYASWANRTGLDPNPDAPEHHYDYRQAYRAGAAPDADLHWPSRFKHDDHPTRFINGIDTKK